MTGKHNQMPQNTTNGADDLEPYRRLIEVQKQLVEMAKQYEQSRRECEALRERVAREMFESVGWRDKLRYGFQRRARKVLRRLPRLTARELLRMVNNKQPSSC